MKRADRRPEGKQEITVRALLERILVVPVFSAASIRLGHLPCAKAKICTQAAVVRTNQQGIQTAFFVDKSDRSH